MADHTPSIRQILVITDGFSNVGEDPVEASARARRRGVTVNVVGVVDGGEMGQKGQDEAMSIADAGGGMCRIVRPAELSATAQMLTHQTMQLTLQQVVSEQLQEVIGKDTIDLPPAQRSKVMQVVDRLEEAVRLELVVCVDTSASMKDKMGTVREALRDLNLSLQAREGESEVAVIAFPGSGDEITRVISEFTPELNLDALSGMLTARGGTPTGPAIDAAIVQFDAKRRRAADEEDGPRGSDATGS